MRSMNSDVNAFTSISPVADLSLYMDTVIVILGV
jgi:hypothetical protein